MKHLSVSSQVVSFHSIPTASEEFPLEKQFPTANEDKLPLLSQSDAAAEELCAAAEVKELLSATITLSNKVEDPISGNINGNRELPPVTTATIPTFIPTDTPQLRHYNRRARIAQSLALLPVTNKPASPIGDGSQGEACPTVSGLVGRSLDEGEEAAEKRSNDTEEMVNVLTSLDATTILSSGVAEVPTSSGSIPTTGPPATGVPTGSDVIPTASPIFTTAIESTPYTRRKGKEKMVEFDTPKKKKLQEQIDVQVARELEEEMARDAHRMNEQIARDAEIARIHAEEELQMMIDGLDKNNEVIAKYLQEYYQAAANLSIREKTELINKLVKYQDHHSKILKYQTQQRKPLTKRQQRDFYMSILRSHDRWKTKHFKGMTLEEIKSKFDPIWRRIQDFIPIGSKEEAERLKGKGCRLEPDSAKKLMTLEDVPEVKLKEMMELIPVEEVYVEALQVKHPIIDWEVHTEGERSYWKIIRLEGSTTSYQFFVDLLKHFDKEDLNQLWD
nr:hypothetical protein [Tanacetum cinerariifolium]